MKTTTTLGLLLLGAAANAAPTDWHFVGTNFVNSNGSLSGRFTHDADTGAVSDIAITTTAGDFVLCLPDCEFAESFAGATYDLSSPSFEFSPGNHAIRFHSNTTDTAMLLLLVGLLDNAGGTRGLVQIREWRCESAPALCPRDIAVTPFRSVFEGVVVADADGIAPDVDNCVLVANPLQTDTDGDNIGNRCDADIAIPNDCLVNFPDLQVMKAAFFSNPASPNWNPDADLTGPSDGPPDSAVNFADLEIIKNSFFEAPGPSAQGCN